MFDIGTGLEGDCPFKLSSYLLFHFFKSDAKQGGRAHNISDNILDG